MSQDKNDNQNDSQQPEEHSSQYSRLGSLQPDYYTSTQYDDLQNSSQRYWDSQRDSYQKDDYETQSQNDGWQNSAASNWYSQAFSGNNLHEDSFWASSQQSGIWFSHFKITFNILKIRVLTLFSSYKGTRCFQVLSSAITFIVILLRHLEVKTLKKSTIHILMMNRPDIHNTSPVSVIIHNLQTNRKMDRTTMIKAFIFIFKLN